MGSTSPLLNCFSFTRGCYAIGYIVVSDVNYCGFCLGIQTLILSVRTSKSVFLNASPFTLEVLVRSCRLTMASFTSDKRNQRC